MNQEIIQFNREFPVGIEVNLLPISKGLNSSIEI
jgi:hypothetical protein